MQKTNKKTVVGSDASACYAPQAKWYKFSRDKGYRQKRPPISKLVLVRIESKKSGSPRSIAVGYRKNASGDKSYPYFVIPGIGGEVYEWCDCLPESVEFHARVL